MKISKIDCYYSAQEFEYFEVEICEKNTPGRYWWNYSGNYYDFVLDFLNGNYRSLVGVSDASWEQEQKWLAEDIAFIEEENRLFEQIPEDFISEYGLSKVEKIIHVDYSERMDATKKDLGKIDAEFCKKLVDHVLISKTHSDLNAAQRYYAFAQSFSTKVSRSMHEFQAILLPSLDFKNWDYEDAVYGKLRDLKTLPPEKKYNQLCKYMSHHKEGKKWMHLKYSYSFTTLSDLFWFLLFEMVRRDEVIKVCPNCNQYFIPLNRSDTVYCDKPAPQDPNKTCREYATYQNFLEKTRTNEAMRLYKQIYNQKANKVRRTKNASPDNKPNPILEADLVQFKEEADWWKERVKTGTKAECQFIAWLKDVKEKKVLTNGNNSKTK